MIGIKDIATFFPGEQVPAKEMPGIKRLPEQELAYFQGVGIDTIHISDEYDGYMLAKSAADLLMEKNNVQGDDIDLIIFIQCRLPEYFMSSSSARLQNEMKAGKALVFSISDLGCTDMTMALKLAKDHLIANQQAENVLICYGNKPYSPSRYRFPVTIYGDGGVALLVSRTEQNQLVDIDIHTDGKYWDLFKVEYKNKIFSEYKEECSSLRKYGFELAIESKIRFLHLNKNLLARNNWNRDEISHFILQNISLRAYEFYETAFDVKLSPVCKYNLRKYGHLGPADIMLNYQAGLEKGLFRPGEKVLIMNNSPVASWSSILIQV